VRQFQRCAETLGAIVLNLTWPNTLFARAFADAILCAHKDCKNKHESDHFVYSTPAPSALFFSIVERSALMALVFLKIYVRNGNPAILSFFLLPKEPSKMQRMRSCAKTCRFVTTRNLAKQ